MATRVLVCVVIVQAFVALALWQRQPDCSTAFAGWTTQKIYPLEGIDGL